MTDIVKKVTVEKFDDEGNLTERVITEYGTYVPQWQSGIKVGDVWPHPSVTGQIISTEDAAKYTLWNDAIKTFHLSDYDYGSFHSHRPGGTDRDGAGEVVDS